MKAKLITLYGTLEAEGTPEELARLFKAYNGAQPAAVSVPYVFSSCMHEYDFSTSSPKCRKCLASFPTYTITRFL